MLFLLGAPRSGTTMLNRILSSHSQILGGPEPHIITALAYSGVWGEVDKAPYDHIVSSLGQKEFIDLLPGGKQDYWAACRAFCDTLYNRRLEGSGKSVCLDKTPEYVTVWPFLREVYPDAKYVVLTRHPVAVFSSFADSFFDGDLELTQKHDPLLDRYVPALAGFLRQQEVPFIHVRYEDLVADPDQWVKQIYDFLELEFEEATIDYGSSPSGAEASGLGDPIGVKQYSRPSASSANKWAQELAADPARQTYLRERVAALDPDDLATIGYPLESFWEPLDEYAGKTAVAKRPRLSGYRLQRKLIVHGRSWVQRFPALRKLTETVRLACSVLLRDY